MVLHYNPFHLVRPNNTVPLFVIMGIIGMCSIPMLPVGMELGCELTRNTDGSAAILWIAYVVFLIGIAVLSDKFEFPGAILALLYLFWVSF